MEPRKCFYSVSYHNMEEENVASYTLKLFYGPLFSAQERRGKILHNQIDGRTNHGLPNYANFVGICSSLIDLCGCAEI